jgi:RNA polymerase sigma-70 factor (ECF subfamily)
MGLTEAQAEENAQEAFVLAAQRMSSIADGKERAYLLGAALRLANNTRRRLSHRLELAAGDDTMRKAVDDRPNAESILQKKQQCDLVDRTLEAMPGILGEVFMLYEIEELTLGEIAVVLEIPAGTAASRLRRAREEFSIQVQRETANLETDWEDP